MSEPVRVVLAWRPSCPVSAKLSEELAKILPILIPRGMKVCRTDEPFAQLRGVRRAVLCLSPEAARDPWVHLQAGAIAARADGAVVPLVLGLDPGELPGPLKDLRPERADQLEGWIRLVTCMVEAMPEEQQEFDHCMFAVRELWESIADRVAAAQA